MAKPRTLIAHDHRLFLDGLALLLGHDFDILSTTTDFATVLDAVRRHRPSLVVQGLTKRPAIGLRLIADIRDACPDSVVAVISRSDDAQIAAEALRQGAGAYILTTSTQAELLDGLHVALTRRVFMAPELAGRIMRSVVTPESPRREALTSRQLAVIRLVAAGRSMKEVATELDVSVRTVAFHKYGVMQRLGIGTTAELVQFAVKRGLV